MGHFFAQLWFLYNYLKISTTKKACKLAVVGLSFGLDFVGVLGHRVPTQTGTCSLIPRFNSEYRHRIKGLVCIFNRGVSVLHVVVFCREWQQLLNYRTDFRPVKDVVQEP